MPAARKLILTAGVVYQCLLIMLAGETSYKIFFSNGQEWFNVEFILVYLMVSSETPQMLFNKPFHNPVLRFYHCYTVYYIPRQIWHVFMLIWQPHGFTVTYINNHVTLGSLL